MSNLLTAAELQAKLVVQQQAEATNIVALIEAVVDERLNLTEADLNALTAKVNGLRDFLDGDPSSDGYQAFNAIVTKLTTLETLTTSQSALISALQTAFATEKTTLQTAISTVQNTERTARELLEARVATLEAQGTAFATARLAKDNEHDTKIAALETASENHQTALIAEVTRAQAAEAAAQAAIGVERARVDLVVGKQGEFVTRDELASSSQNAAQVFIDGLWAGRARPAGLPNANGSVSQ